MDAVDDDFNMANSDVAKFSVAKERQEEEDEEVIMKDKVFGSPTHTHTHTLKAIHMHMCMHIYIYVCTYIPAKYIAT